ncbi:MAG: hypothetical protein AAF968_14820 [Pseudomonadota bacterium]
MLCVVHEFSPEALAVKVGRRLNFPSVIEMLAELVLQRGVPARIRPDNCRRFVAKALRVSIGAQTWPTPYRRAILTALMKRAPSAA